MGQDFLHFVRDTLLYGSRLLGHPIGAGAGSVFFKGDPKYLPTFPNNEKIKLVVAQRRRRSGRRRRRTRSGASSTAMPGFPTDSLMPPKQR